MEYSWISGKQYTIKVQLGGNRKLREKTKKTALCAGYIFELVPNIAHRLWIWCIIFLPSCIEALCALNWWIQEKCLYYLMLHSHLIKKWHSWHTHTHTHTHPTFILPGDSLISPKFQCGFVRIHRVMWHCIFIMNIAFKGGFLFFPLIQFMVASHRPFSSHLDLFDYRVSEKMKISLSVFPVNHNFAKAVRILKEREEYGGKFLKIFLCTQAVSF